MRTRFYLAMTTLALAGAVGITPSAVLAQTVRGQAVDALGDQPVIGARIVLLAADSSIVDETDSDSNGRFQLVAQSGGTYTIQASALGYASYRSVPFGLAAGTTVDVVVRMGVDAIPLEPFSVVASGRTMGVREMEFERRRNDPSIGGHFLDREEIARRPTATATQLLTQLPGPELFRISTPEHGMGLQRSLIYLPGSRGSTIRSGYCLAQVYVNGARVRQSEDRSAFVSVDDMLEGAPIIAVEVYSRAFQAPIEYQGSGECGVVLYWTEEPSSSSTRGWGMGRLAIGVGALVGLLLFGFSS